MDELLLGLRRQGRGLVFLHLAYLSPTELYALLKELPVGNPVRALFNERDAFQEFHLARMGVADAVEWLEEDIIARSTQPIHYWRLWMSAYKAVHENSLYMEFEEGGETYELTLFDRGPDEWALWLSVRGRFPYNTSRHLKGYNRLTRNARQRANVEEYRNKPFVRNLMGRLFSIMSPKDGFDDVPSNCDSRKTHIYAGPVRRGDVVPALFFERLGVLEKVVVKYGDTEVMRYRNGPARWWFVWTKAMVAYMLFEYRSSFMPWDVLGRGEVFLRSCVGCNGMAYYLSGKDEIPVCGRKCQSKI